MQLLISLPPKRLDSRRRNKLVKAIRHQRKPRCHYCRRKMRLSRATMDHVIPQSAGGLNHPANLVVCCGSCNASKGNLSLSEWRERVMQIVTTIDVMTKGGAE